ncbi:MAG: aminotransferase class V-fold PLP-dependent enzyme [Ruminococcaceae bacterium]|nr:aminotransferase class V-fold PLP-dependent enzyme [Oscillospiraceae bacterium]
MIYFDSAATSLLRPPSVRRAVSGSIGKHAGYGRSGHRAAEKAAEAVFACRSEAAKLFGLVDETRVVFCTSATQALNTAIMGLPLQNKAAVISGYEHNAVRRPLVRRSERDGLEIRIAQSRLFDRDDAVRAFDRLLDQRCGLCVCTMVSNVFGNLLPVEEIGRMCRERGIVFVVDASQAAGSLPVDAGRIGADIICVPGHKGLLGPVGTGMMLLCTDVRPEPLLFGGTGGESRSLYQPETIPERFESGTLNVAGICGLCEGIRYVRKHLPKIRYREEKLVRELKYALQTFSGIRVYDSGSEPCGSLFSFTADGWHPEELAQKLAERGIAVRAGLHCAPLAHESVGTACEGTVRVSLCGENTDAEVLRFCRTLWTILMRK